MAAKFGHCFRELGAGRQGRTLCPPVTRYGRRLYSRPDVQRRPARQCSSCSSGIWMRHALPDARHLTSQPDCNSARTIRYIRDLRRRMTPFGKEPVRPRIPVTSARTAARERSSPGQEWSCRLARAYRTPITVAAPTISPRSIIFTASSSRYPRNPLGLVDVGPPDLLRANRVIEILGRVGVPDHRLERHHQLRPLETAASPSLPRPPARRQPPGPRPDRRTRRASPTPSGRR